MPQKSKTIAVDTSEETTQALAFGTLLKLNWNIKYAGEQALVAYTPKKWNKVSDEVIIETRGNELTIKSKLIHREYWDIYGKNKKHINAFMEAFEPVKTTASPNDISDWQTQIAALKEQTKIEAQKEVERYKEADKVMNFSGGKMYVTYAIIAINTAIFLLMVAKGMDFFEPKVLDVLKWGGSLPSLTLGGDWWRLITNVFLHFGIIHLAMNMYALYFIGSNLEPMLGKVRYIIAYLCAGIGASLVSVLWHKDAVIVSAGASGAIFGMFGVFLALLTTNIIPKHIKGQLMQSILIFVAYNVFYGFKAGSGVDNSAHLGGLASGMLIGYLYYFTFKQLSVKKTQLITATVAILTAVVTFLIVKQERLTPVEINFENGSIIRQTDKLYQEKLDAFSALQDKAVAVDQKQSIDQEELLKELQNIVNPAWKEARTVLNQADQYADMDIRKEQLELLKKYADLRLKGTDLRIRTLKENTGAYADELKQNTEEINAVLEKLNNPDTEPPK